VLGATRAEHHPGSAEGCLTVVPQPSRTVVAENRRPRVLYVCSCWPADRAYGGQLRTLHLARALQRISDVTILVVGANETDHHARALTEQEFHVADDIRVEPLRASSLRRWTESLINRGFVNIHGVSVSQEDEHRVLDLARQYDLVWFCKLRTANYFRSARWQRAVVDVDDLPSAVASSAGRNNRLWSMRLLARARTWMLMRHEQRLLDRFASIVVCSETDKQRFGATNAARVQVIPNGFEVNAGQALRAPTKPPRIGFIGLFDYAPNLDGVRWFVDECLEQVRRQVPGVRVRLVGKHTDGPLKPDHSAVDGLGWVDDPSEEIATWSAMIVPVRMGGGTRIKIAEAFSRRCPVVSTSYGAYGYEVRDGMELRLADTPAEFAAACVWTLLNGPASVAMADRAHEAFLERWTWGKAATRAREVATELLSRGTPAKTSLLIQLPRTGEQSL
jgi:polysaccharide biosynthesis protein PslH